MAFKGQLNFKGKTWDVLDCSYKFTRDVDSKGRPASPIYGGKIYIHIESTPDSIILENMTNQFKPHSGTITFKKGDEDAKMKELKWDNGYITDFEEALNSIGVHPMTTRFVISAQKISVGNAHYEEDWPED
ncbi:type VI secretion system tube protein TssD [Bacteroides faecium]|uniref:Type VI secretion system needle protein Hcp n=1 Tax=Bacteroides faecium TaxID=2715212 RepID=A0A6H0KNK1_9BACE|nr:type VI secretion system tube protein TssD [Bacteroides faecium]QIU94855.1 type VI secretion system needle protein Hcp [Bacteroides faecium]